MGWSHVTRTIREVWCDSCVRWKPYKAGAHVCKCGHHLAAIKEWGPNSKLYKLTFGGGHEPGKMLFRKRLARRRTKKTK